MNTGPCAECGESTHHKDGCRAWEMQLRPATPTATTTMSTAPTEEVWRRRLNGCRKIRRLLDGAEAVATDALLYPARGIGSADDNERLDKSFRHLYQLAMGEVARLGGDEVCLDALAMLLPLEFGRVRCGAGGPYAECFGCEVNRLPHRDGCAWLGLMRRAGLR